MDWYRDVRRAFEGILDAPSKEGVMGAIAALRAKGVSPVSINTYLRGLKAYLRWAEIEGHIADPPKIPFLKTEKKVLATLGPDQISRLMAFHPKGVNATRTWVAALLMLDGGLRISEVLGLRREAVDFENLVLRIVGKGETPPRAPLDGDAPDPL